MSYFEDYIQDGACCEGCGVYLGEDVGFIRRCSSCEPVKVQPSKSSGMTKTQKRNAQRVRANIRKREASKNAQG